jgi:hypothetical protein
MVWVLVSTVSRRLWLKAMRTQQVFIETEPKWQEVAYHKQQVRCLGKNWAA